MVDRERSQARRHSRWRNVRRDAWHKKITGYEQRLAEKTLLERCRGGCDTAWRGYLYLENTKEVLVPPNPKLFEKETLTVFCCAELGT